MSANHKTAGFTIVITGASSGFGRGAAIQLAAQGAHVVLAARRIDVLENLANEIRAAGGQATAMKVDVSDPADIVALAAKALEPTGRIDVWINNVGVGALGLFWDIPIEDHARVIDVNLKGLLYGAHAAIRQFRAQGNGVLLNVGSIDSEVPLAFQCSYAATKAAVLSLSRSLDQELRLAGHEAIKVGTILPWAVDTPWWIHAANYSGHTPRMAGMDDPEIVVDAIVAACTDPKLEQAVGWRATSSHASHSIFPGLTERLSANIAASESEKGERVPDSTGAIYEPMAEGAGIGGGIRERMEREDGERK